MYYLLLSHYNNGNTNASQCYVIRTLAVFLSRKVFKLASVWQLKIVPAAGENSIVRGSVKWGLLFDFFAHKAIMNVTTVCSASRKNSLYGLSLDLMKHRKWTQDSGVQTCLGITRTATVFVWMGSTSRRPVFFLTLVCEGPAAGNGLSASCVFWWRLRMGELLNVSGWFHVYVRPCFERPRGIAKSDC